MANIGALKKIVTIQLEQLSALIAALDSENAAIQSHDLTALQSSINAKLEQFALLESSGQTLLHVISQMGYKGEMDQISAWLTANHPSINPLWSELRSHLNDVQYKNEVNGKLINSMQKFYSDVITSVTQSPVESESYENTGQSKTSHFHRDLGSA